MFGKNQIITNNFLTFPNFLYDVFAQKIMGRTAMLLVLRNSFVEVHVFIDFRQIPVVRVFGDDRTFGRVLETSISSFFTCGIPYFYLLKTFK